MDAGIFAFLVIVGFSSLFLSLKFGSVVGAMFSLLGAIAFFIVAIAMFGEYDVAYAVSTDDGTTIINQTKYIIGDGDPDTDTQGNWLAWIFFGMGLLNCIIFFLELTG